MQTLRHKVQQMFYKKDRVLPGHNGFIRLLQQRCFIYKVKQGRQNVPTVCRPNISTISSQAVAQCQQSWHCLGRLLHQQSQATHQRISRRWGGATCIRPNSNPQELEVLLACLVEQAWVIRLPGYNYCRNRHPSRQVIRHNERTICWDQQYHWCVRHPNMLSRRGRSPHDAALRTCLPPRSPQDYGTCHGYWCRETRCFYIHPIEQLRNLGCLRTWWQVSPYCCTLNSCSSSNKLSQGLPFLHAILGCDTTSNFCGIGKKTAWDI